MALRTEEQLSRIAALSKTLREQFHEDLPARGIYRDFTVEQAQCAIHTLAAILAAHQATKPLPPMDQPLVIQADGLGIEQPHNPRGAVVGAKP